MMNRLLPLAGLLGAVRALEVSDASISVFSGQDSLRVVSDPGDFDPEALVLVDELLFFTGSLTLTVTDAEFETANATGSADGEISLSLLLNGERFFQPTVFFSVSGPGDSTVVFTSEQIQVDSDPQDPPKFSSRGEHIAVATIDVTIGGETTLVSTETSAVVISAFESVLFLLVLVVLAILSRNVHFSMFMGIWTGSLVITQGDIRLSFVELFDVHMIPSITDDYNFRTITFTLFLGGFIALIRKSGGQAGFTALVSKYARSAKTTQLAAVFAGVGLFFDDYSSALILGSSFKTLTDAFYVSREKLAFVVDSTSAPIASIAPISSWIAFELGLISGELDNIDAASAFDTSGLDDPYPFFLNTIPSRFYPIFMLILQVTLIICGIEFGPMLLAERKTRVNLRTDGGDGKMEVAAGKDASDPDDDTPSNALNFFIPLLFFLCTLLASMIQIGKGYLEPGDAYTLRNIFGSTDAFFALIYSTMGASLFTALFYSLQARDHSKSKMHTPATFLQVIDCRFKSSAAMAAEGFGVDEAALGGPRPLLYFMESVNVWIEGFKNLVPSILVLCLAFTIKSVVLGAATDRLFTDIILQGDIAPESLPTVVFIVACLLSFCTGTSWGTMSIMFPLVGFASFEVSRGDEDIFTLTLSAILAGAIFGDHCSILSDTTILSSIGSGCQITAHVYTQMPYAVWGALFSILLGLLPAGYGANVWLMLIIGAVALVFLTIVIAAPVVSVDGGLDLFSEAVLALTKSKNLQAVKESTKKFAAERPDMVDPNIMGGLRLLVSRLRGQDRDESIVVVTAEKVENSETALKVNNEETEVPAPAKEVKEVADAPKSVHDV